MIGQLLYSLSVKYRLVAKSSLLPMTFILNKILGTELGTVIVYLATNYLQIFTFNTQTLNARDVS